jgi:hypothetical protein
MRRTYERTAGGLQPPVDPRSVPYLKENARADANYPSDDFGGRRTKDEGRRTTGILRV